MSLVSLPDSLPCTKFGVLPAAETLVPGIINARTKMIVRTEMIFFIDSSFKFINSLENKIY